MRELSIDFETHSGCDLKAHGAYRYAKHPSTGVYVMGYVFSDDPDTCDIWVPGDGEPFPAEVSEHFARGGIINAWNAAFERLILWHVVCPRYGAPRPAIEQFHCTAARARAHGMPGALADAARALGLRQQKLGEGKNLINTYSVHNTPWSEIPPDDCELWCDYVADDVFTEMAAMIPLRELTPHEWREYHVNERINDAGVPLDLDLVRAGADYADELRGDADGMIAELTGGAVTTARQRKSRDAWVLPQLSDSQKKTLTVHKKGKDKVSFDQDHRDALASDPECPAPVLRYLALVDEAGGASLRKYQAMLNRQIDGTLHGALMFNGAGQTGRFSSTGLQIHNLKRSTLGNPDPIIADLMEGYELDDPSGTLAQLVRSCIYDPGDGLTWGDWSNIEGRLAPWLSGSRAGERKLDVFREGGDPYINNAAATFHVEPSQVTKEQRQAGKVQELALQFLGGAGAMMVMGAGYGLHLTEEQAEQMKVAWRAVNPWAMEFGRELEQAAFSAVTRPGHWQAAGRVGYAYDGHSWLWCRLPSGRYLAYYKPQIEDTVTPWGDPAMQVTCVWGSAKPKVGEKWPRRHMYGGRWLENVTQAAAADILREKILACHDRGLPIVLHVHDEIILRGRGLQSELEQIMLELPDWAAGLPLAAEVETGDRYGK